MTHTKVLLSVLVACLAYYYYKSSLGVKPNSPIVETLSGKVRGIISISRDEREFYEYLGIPYAKPPTGPLRFEPPEPVDKWSGIRDASSYGSICLQVDNQNKKIDGEEDCLFLNVFVSTKPSTSENKLLPTLVWIHGGAFVFGSGNMYRPDYFMDFSCILVTLNYRLGSLGFLNTGDNVVRGNMGLKDQNMALQWIRNNIRYFGGDPSQVLLFGESAGAVSVAMHILSPLSKGLFQTAISQSGQSLSTWASRTNHVEQAHRFSKIIGCPTTNSTTMTQCMKSMDGKKLMEGSYDDITNNLRDPISMFNPSVEHVNDEKAFLSDHPFAILHKGTFNKVKWITGINEHEGLLISIPLWRDGKLEEVSKEFHKRVHNLMWLQGEPDIEVMDKIKNYYFGEDNPNSIDKLQNWTDMFTHSGFGTPAHQSIILHSKHAPVYAYFYSYKGGFSLAELLLAIPGKYPVVLEYLYYFIPRWFMAKVFGIKPPHPGVCHLDEAAMLFNLKGLVYVGPSDADYVMSKLMTKTWVEFASNSRPLQFNGVIWPPADSKVDTPVKYMQIDIESSLIVAHGSAVARKVDATVQSTVAIRKNALRV